MSDLLRNDHPISPDCNDFRQASKVWSDSETVTSSVYNILAFGMKLGADRELKACLNWVDKHCSYAESRMLMADRRPEPLSIKEKALKQLKELEQHGVLDCNIDHIREALEELDD